MGNGHKAHFEGSNLHGFRPSARRDHSALGVPAIIHLAPRDIGGKGAGINRRAQFIVVMRNGAHMIFVRMGDEHGLKAITPRFQPRNIGKDQIHPGRAVHIRKRHAQIHKDEPLLVWRTHAVDIGVHTNFTRPAEGQIDHTFTAHFGL